MAKNYYDDRAILTAKSYFTDYLKEKGFLNNYKHGENIRCISNSHTDNKPSFKIYEDTNTAFCYGCFKYFNIFDCVREIENITNYYDQVDFICKKYGIEPTNKSHSNIKDKSFLADNKTRSKGNIYNKINNNENDKAYKISQNDFINYKFNEVFKKATKSILDLEDKSYMMTLTNRGISTNTIEQERIVYCDNLNTPIYDLIDIINKDLKQNNKRSINYDDYNNKLGVYYNILIPYYDDNNNLLYYIPMKKFNNNESNEFINKLGNYSNLKSIDRVVINQHKLQDPSVKYFFVVEGSIDYLTVKQIINEQGFLNSEVLCLLGTSGINNLEKYIKNNNLEEQLKDRLFISLLDCDVAGLKAQDELKNKLSSLGLYFYDPKIFKPYKKQEDFTEDDNRLFQSKYKDPNDYYRGYKDLFVSQLTNMYSQLDVIYDEEKNNKLNNYYNSFKSDLSIDDFINFQHLNNTDFIKIGFKNIDDKLFLKNGLITIGGASGLGKTNFILQIATNLAEQGHDVLFFNLEMEKRDLIGRILSRLTHILSEDNTDISKLSSFTITNNKREMMNLSELKKKNFLESCKAYKEMYENKIFFINNQLFNTSLDTIKESIIKHINITKNKPIVIIDYLQLIDPTDDYLTDKQAIDKIIKELKIMSFQNNICIFLISSLNRQSYKEPINLSSFKESGLIEFTSDVVIGLQYADLNNKDKNKATEIQQMIEEKHDKDEPLEVECKILKNRFGKVFTANLYHCAKYSHYETDKNCYSKRNI